MPVILSFTLFGLNESGQRAALEAPPLRYKVLTLMDLLGWNISP